MRQTAVLVPVVAAAPWFPPAVAGQDATPAAGFVEPGPAWCTVAPRPIASLVAIVEGSALATPEPVFAPDGAPVGEPADAATVAAVEATVYGVVACGIAGEELRRLAFFTDAGSARFQEEHPLTAEQVGAIFGGTPVAGPAEGRESVRVSDVRVLGHGRVGAFSELRNPEGRFTSYLVLLEEGGRYLIDASYLVDVEAFVPVQRPTPPTTEGSTDGRRGGRGTLPEPTRRCWRCPGARSRPRRPLARAAMLRPPPG